MADITDTLTMILRIQQVDTVVGAFRIIADAVDGAIKILDDWESALYRTQFFLQEFGASMPIAQINEMTRQISLSTGQTQTAIAGTEAYVARFRGTGTDIQRLTKDIADASLATGKSMEEVGHIFESIRAGHGRMAWRELGIQVRGVEGQLYSTNQIMNIFEQHFSGFAEQFKDTLPGAIRQTNVAFQDMLLQLSRLLTPEIVGIANALATAFEFIAEMAKRAADALGIVLPDLGGGAGGAGGDTGETPTEKYLSQIAFNTGPQGPLGRALTGGGAFAAAPGGAVGIRDFNVMVRHVR